MTDQDIIDFNIHFLMLARDMARVDPIRAQVHFGLSEQDVDALLNLSLKDLAAISTNTMPLVRITRPIRQTGSDPVEGFAMAMTFFGKSFSCQQ